MASASDSTAGLSTSVVHFDDYPPYLIEISDMTPSSESSVDQDRDWTKASLAPVLQGVPLSRRHEIWDAVTWIWRLKVVREEDRHDEHWDRIFRAWMVRPDVDKLDFSLLMTGAGSIPGALPRRRSRLL